MLPRLPGGPARWGAASIETSEELLPAREVAGSSDHGVNAVFSAPSTAPVRPSARSPTTPAATGRGSRATSRAAARYWFVDVVTRYNPEAVVCARPIRPHQTTVDPSPWRPGHRHHRRATSASSPTTDRAWQGGGSSPCPLCRNPTTSHRSCSGPTSPTTAPGRPSKESFAGGRRQRDLRRRPRLQQGDRRAVDRRLTPLSVMKTGSPTCSWPMRPR